MTKTESFLLPLFQELQKQGIPLGMSEYLLALKSIREGIGIEDIDRLERFLKLLWAKSQEDREIFNLKFTELVKPRLYKPIIIASKINEDEPSTDSSNKSITASPSSKNNQVEKSNQIKTETKTKTPTKQQQYNIPARSSRELSSIRNLSKSTYKKNPYNLIPRLPMSQRDMTVSWRHLRRLRREGIAEDLDVQETINDICKTGFFRRPVLQPRRRNQVELVLLIDREGSMSPFNPLMKALQKSIEKGGLLGKISTYYFHDCPEVYFYKKPNLTQTCPIEDVLSEQVRDNSVLIVSDAGAARRTYDGQRLKETKAFIKQLRQYTYLYAWLNPVPQSRWKTTTAENIGEFVPMYPLDRQGLNDIVKILIGHPFPPGVRLDDQDS
ncbi:VWA domain-containing protein [Mastigocoleus testarum]|uniref:VWA containing CoxE family protein n=1 Tax=Mastigocoleus testarum BC008 TaxID=371196 RepID=A0A0V7ZQH6_9CYAN|nr:VWA domain-containing protein [Mastigocoleus testarum]KST66731.1 hypothetical protein BC008_26430 [Mastigocoleus testarum BC008]